MRQLHLATQIAMVIPSLRSRITQCTETATKCGALRPLKTTTSIRKEAGTDFIIHALDMEAFAAKQKNGMSNAESAVMPATKTALPELSSRAKNHFDPFIAENREAALTVCNVGDEHILMLNKFNVVTDHALLVTSDFVAQDDPLTPSDFDAIYCCLRSVDSLAFYNSGPLSGASQRHRHLQLICNDTFLEATSVAAAPIEAIIDKVIKEKVMPPGEPFILEAFPFSHFVCTLPDLPTTIDGETHSEYSNAESTDSGIGTLLHGYYEKLLDLVGYSFPGDGRRATSEITGAVIAYNLILTTKWLMVVGRTRADDPESKIDVNAMGFFGCLLTKGCVEAEIVERRGPLAVLKAVTAPPVRLKG